MISSSSIRLLAFLVWTLLSGVAALAQTALTLGVRDHDTDLPVEITSTELMLDHQDGSAVFSGEVVVRQGSIILTCERMRVEYYVDSETGEDRIAVIEMSDSVTFASDSEAVEAEQAIYTPTDNKIVMSGSVLIVQGAFAISADTLEYDLQNGTGRAGGQVRTILQSNEN